ncbi:DUF945 family protein [Thalassotalea piscium]
MNKAVLAIGAIVCAGLIGPKVVGTIVEKEYNTIASRMDENPSIEITERTFESNWFTGQAMTKIKIKGAGPAADDFQLVVTEQLTFGPIIFADNSIKFALAHSDADLNLDISTANQEEQEKLTNFTDKLNENLSISSVISYGLNYTTMLKMAEMTIDEDGTELNIGAIDSEFTLKDEKYMDGYLNWSGLALKAPDVNVDVSGLDATFEQEIISGNVYAGNSLAVGDFTMLMKSIIAQDKSGNETFRIENLTLSADSKIEDELMNIGVNYGADSFKGAGQSLEKLNLDISFNKLDPKVLVELNEWVTKMSQEPDNAEKYIQQLTATASKLLEKDPEINIDDFSVITPEGEIKSDLQFTIDNTLFDQSNPMSIMAAMKADAKGMGPLAFFQKLGLEPMINMYVDQGFIVKEADKLSFAAQFEQGKLTLNGKVMAL